jgi:DNA (cytosine-5)-methyltransferase 1
MMLTVGSTFTGVGGADLGLERARFSVAWQCELDEWKRSVLASHWPNVPIYDDITTLYDPTPVDLLIGGFPCQDLSVAGKRKGFDGDRSVLAFEFLRLAESIAPRWILLENVPGLLTSNRGRDFARLVDEMVGCGYGMAWRVLDARYFGVPQRRRRVFLAARRDDSELDPRSAGRLALRALCESSDGDLTPGWPPRQDATPDVGSGSQGGRVYSPHGDAAETVTGTLTRMYSEQSGQDYAGGAGVIAYRKSARVSGPDTPETWVNDGRANTLNGFDVGNVRTTHAIIDSATMVRRLSPVECERLMGWPDGWTAPEGVKAPDSKRYAACGDGIVSWVAYWIGQRIRMIEEEEA